MTLALRELVPLGGLYPEMLAVREPANREEVPSEPQAGPQALRQLEAQACLAVSQLIAAHRLLLDMADVVSLLESSSAALGSWENT